MPGFQKDLSTSWSWPFEDQMRVYGLLELEEVSVGQECEETNGMAWHSIACVDSSWT